MTLSPAFLRTPVVTMFKYVVCLLGSTKVGTTNKTNIPDINFKEIKRIQLNLNCVFRIATCVRKYNMT
jgi:hypothetical protein